MLKRLDEAALETLLTRAETADGHAAAADRRRAPGADRAWPMATAAICSTWPRSCSRCRPKAPLDTAALARPVQRRAPLYDKAQEGHYNLISALHKSLRGSDTDAALYWLARMLAGGEDPLYIARRLVRFAVEDIGLADPQALVQALAAWDAYERLGSPEGELALAQAVDLSRHRAQIQRRLHGLRRGASAARDETGSLMPPMHILNAPTKLMKELGYGNGYDYDHDTAEGFSGQNYFPDEHAAAAISTARSSAASSARSRKRLDYWAKLRERRAEDDSE